MRLPLFIPVERTRLLARLLCRGDVVGLVLRADGAIDIRRRSGAVQEAAVDASTVAFSALIVLRYRLDGRIGSLVLPRVATGDEAHRRLRVWLRNRARTGVVSASVAWD